jgi:hypothetical protein
MCPGHLYTAGAATALRAQTPQASAANGVAAAVRTALTLLQLLLLTRPASVARGAAAAARPA